VFDKETNLIKIQDQIKKADPTLPPRAVQSKVAEKVREM